MKRALYLVMEKFKDAYWRLNIQIYFAIMIYFYTNNTIDSPKCKHSGQKYL